MNSRPLYPQSNDPDDLTPLTPGHFLIGGSLISPPERNLENVNINYISRWNLCQKLKQDFWKRWSTEYLSRLQNRPKWKTQERNVKTGDLVILKEDNLPPSSWILARIIETHAGRDGHIRVVTLKTENSQLKRPITKICPLPIPESDEYQPKQNSNQ